MLWISVLVNPCKDFIFSKPGLRVYAGKDELPRVLGGLGIAILSTNQGIITDKEARKLQVGGEVLAFVW
jgi:small subunit ribosomal protein S8